MPLYIPIGHTVGEVDHYKLIGERLELRVEQIFQKTQQIMGHKLELHTIRMQQAIDQVEALNRKIEHVEWALNRFQQAKTDMKHMFEEKLQELLKLQSHLQLKQDQLAKKQDLLHTTIVGDSWSMPTPTISSPPCHSPTLLSSSIPYQKSHTLSTPGPSAQKRPPQFNPTPSASVTCTADAGVKPTSKSCEDVDDDLLSFLSGELELPPIFSQRKELSSIVEPTVPFIQPCVDSERMSHVGSQHSGAMDWPPPTVLPQREGVHVDSQQLGVMELPPLTLRTQAGMQPSNITSKKLASGFLQPSDNILAQNKDLWKEEHVTKLANKLARYSYFGDAVLLQSTLTGREGVALDDTKIQALIQDIQRVACYSMTQTEFDEKIKPKIREGISNLCRRLRNCEKKKKRKESIAGVETPTAV